MLFTLSLWLVPLVVDPPVEGVFPELPGAGVEGVEVDPPVVAPPVDGVFPELPGAGVEGVDGVDPPVDGLFPELPGAGAVPELLEVVDTGVATTVVLTGVVARVTNVADLRTAGGVSLAVAEALEAFPPPELP